MHKPLRILIVVDLAWDVRLGAIRVFMGLADAWRAAGYTVEKYCLTDAYPMPTSSRFSSVLRQLFFPWKAVAFVRKNRDRFDVIDSLLGTLPFPKKRLRFAGLLVARSVGFYRLYQDFEQMRLEQSPDRPRGKLLGRIFYSFMNKAMSKASDNALRNCDLLNLPNDEELCSLRAEIGSHKPTLVQPYGLTAARRRELLQAAAPPAERLSKKKVSFIGMWSPRKGAKDWGKIVRLVRAAVPDARFIFLGTLVQDRQVLDDLGLPRADFIELVAEYQPEQLPQLLADSTAGAFPSYAEAFGFGVLEQLAARVPCVAYDAAGPRTMLKDDLPELLIPVGEVETFAETLTRVLRRDLAEYEKLSRRSAEAAARFNWSTIAEQTAESYRAHLSGEVAECR
jgi:glycosyltransferase involved in cell wall biosynthesis